MEVDSFPGVPEKKKENSFPRLHHFYRSETPISLTMNLTNEGGFLTEFKCGIGYK